MVLPLMVSASAWMRLLALINFSQHRRQISGAVVIFTEILSGRLHVDEQRHVEAEFFPILDRQLDAAWRAMALMWIGALVEPPMAE